MAGTQGNSDGRMDGPRDKELDKEAETKYRDKEKQKRERESEREREREGGSGEPCPSPLPRCACACARGMCGLCMCAHVRLCCKMFRFLTGLFRLRATYILRGNRPERAQSSMLTGKHAN